jgi:anti-sigma factor RsiW
MTCAEWTRKLETYLDGELSSEEIVELEKHLRACPGCTAESLRRVQWKRAVHSAGQRYAADYTLRERIQKQVAGKSGDRLSWRWWPAFALPVVVLALLAGAALLQQNTRRVRNSQIVSELADLHVATLASATPVDVVSSDRHTVKPWFAGKIPFTFNLPDLQGSPFELVGGRLTYLEQSPGAELVFRVRKHEVVAFVFQEKVVASDFPSAGEMDARSFHLKTWKGNGLRYFVIGDVSAEDLRALSERLRNAQ